MNPSPQVVRRPVRRAAFDAFLSLLERLGDGRQNLLRVLTYHRVMERDVDHTRYPGVDSATPEAFADQMRFVSRHYRVVSVYEVMEAISGAKPLPPKSLLITFDDAYCDFAEHAWPIMQEWKVPATLFVATDFPDQPQRVFWWDRLHRACFSGHAPAAVETACGSLKFGSVADRVYAFSVLSKRFKSLPHRVAMEFLDELCVLLRAPAADNSVLGWDELRRLALEGVAIGAHTRTHPLMNRVSTNMAREELKGSLADLQRELGDVLPIFAYPGGGLNEQVLELVREEGIRLAFSTQRGINDLNTADPLCLRRIHVSRHLDGQTFRFKLLCSSRYLGRWAHSH